ncbi:NADPH-dependent glutamate synthase [[Eubacterium] cellulosolvens]
MTPDESEKILLRTVSEQVLMPKQPPQERVKNFQEVALGYDEKSAITAAKRCLQCPKPSCRDGCPVEIDIPQFIHQIAETRYEEAIRVLKKYTNLPGVCGRVCPAEDQCEHYCVLEKTGNPVTIGYLERFAADREMEKGPIDIDLPPPTGRRVAVIGSGPAGITAAGDLAKLGHQVTLFETLHQPGGVLTYGIPEFRVPKRVVQYEVDFLKRLRVQVETNIIIGRTLTLDDLFEMGYEAVFIGIGAGTPKFLNIPGENLGGVYTANEFLTRCNLMRAFTFPTSDTPIYVGRAVAVIGGGNVAMDAARMARRLNPDEVTVLYRRSEQEMPARPPEVENAKEEGIKFRFLTAPVKMMGDERGVVRQVECLRMELGEPDRSGRRRPIPVPDSNFNIAADTVIVAIGSTANPLIRTMAQGLALTEEGLIITDPKTSRTSREAVWSGGDIVTGEATVISAMGAGKIAAKDIHQWLMKKENHRWNR